MKVTVSGEAALDLLASAERHGDMPAERLGRAINLLHFLEDQELAGCRIVVHDPRENTLQHLLLGKNSPLNETDHFAM